MAGEHWTDADVAARVRMLGRNDLDHEMVCVAARDRIIRLAGENQRLKLLLAAIRAVIAEHDKHP